MPSFESFINKTIALDLIFSQYPLLRTSEIKISIEPYDKVHIKYYVNTIEEANTLFLGVQGIPLGGGVSFELSIT